MTSVLLDSHGTGGTSRRRVSGPCRVLFFAEAVTLAHVARPVVLAEALRSAGFAVWLAWDPRYRKLFPDLPFPEVTLSSLSSECFRRALARGSPVYSVETLRGYVRQDLGVIERVEPDVVVGDFRLSLAVSTELSQVPYVALTNAYWSPYAGERFPVPDLPLIRALGQRAGQRLFDLARPLAFAYHALPLNRVRREHGLRALGWDLRTIYTYGDYTLYADIPELLPTADRPPNHHYLGPLLWSPSHTMPDWWDDIPPNRPLVYVNLGSSGERRLLPVVLAALKDLPVSVLAATLGHAPAECLPANAFVADYLPGDAAAARASLVICNGGNPATYQALAEGAPVLGIASNMDQMLNMSAVARAGAGHLLRERDASCLRIRTCAAEIMGDVAYTQVARRLASVMARYQASERFREIIEGIAPGQAVPVDGQRLAGASREAGEHG